MALPRPVQGLVIRYSYLWHAEKERGLEEGVKDRPCAVILVTQGSDERGIVTVLPITHRPPDDDRLAVELPAVTKARLGLDGDRSWVMLSEANRFEWPGPDLRPGIAGVGSRVAYGLLPFRLMDEIRLRFFDVLRKRRASVVIRTD